MLDYKLLQALAAVIENGGFERAGEVLGLTQSAVSQRIKSLEVRLGQPVLVRHPELQATPAGNKLLNHFQQVQLLERDLRKTIPALAEDTTRLRIAINADSLATWWASVVGDFCSREGLLLDLVIEDQDVGLKRMRDGDVAALQQQPACRRRAVRGSGGNGLHAHGDAPVRPPVFSRRHHPGRFCNLTGHCFWPQRSATTPVHGRLRLPWPLPLPPLPFL